MRGERRERGTEGGFCSKTEGGVLAMPSVFLTTSGLNGVLHPIHLQREKSERKAELHSILIKLSSTGPDDSVIYSAGLQTLKSHLS